MSSIGKLIGVACAVTIGGAASPGPQRSTATVVYEAQLDTLLAAFDTLTAAISAGSTPQAQRAFRHTRTAYKQAEGLIAFYAPEVVTAIEGPLEAEPENELPPRPFNTPGAFVGVEGAIFPSLDDSLRRGLGYAPRIAFETGLKATVRWYQENRSWWEPLKRLQADFSGFGVPVIPVGRDEPAI